MKSIAIPIFLLILLAALTGCSSVSLQTIAPSVPAGSAVRSEVPGAAVSSTPAPEQSVTAGENEASSSALVPEWQNLSGQYGKWLHGLWRDPEHEEYYFSREGEGTWSDAEGSDFLRFSWQVLAERDAEPQLYLYFEGSEQPQCLTPVFDVDRLVLLDETGEVLCALEPVNARD